MSTRTFKTFLLLCCAIGARLACAGIVETYEITGYFHDAAAPGFGGAIHGGDTDIPQGGGLVSGNTTASFENAYVDFSVGLSGTPTDVARLRVRLLEASSYDNIMMARTSNSQGLMDPGTFTFAAENVSTATLQFEWLSLDGTSPYANPYLITSYDLDHQQYVSMPSAQVDQYFLSENTELTYSDIGGVTLFQSGNNNAEFDQADAAFAVATPDASIQEFTVGTLKGDAILFMFEFRNPPSNLTTTLSPDLIPEPASVGLMVVTALAAFGIRRTFMI